MHDALGVRRVERVGDLRPEVDEAIGLKGTPADGLRQHLSVEHLHREEMTPFVLADFVDRANVGVVQAGNRARFVLKARDAAISIGREELDNDLSAQREILGAIHDRAGALPELLPDAVMRDRLSCHVRAIAARADM